MKTVDLHGLNTRRFIINKRTHQQLNNKTNNRFGCIILIFISIVVILALCIIYFTATFPIFDGEENDNDSSDIINTIVDERDERDTTDATMKSEEYKEYKEYKSIISLDAVPFLVGLGAEKSGSTSLGAAMYNSGEFTCPDTDEIDVETKYWSDCFDWNKYDSIMNNEIIDKLRNELRNKNGGHCSIKQYSTYQRWRNGKYKFEKSVDYLGLPYVTHIFSELFVKERGTKIFVMIRYPPPRISSTWKFFVGAEKDNMPNEYGNPQKFAYHLLKNQQLKDLINSIDPKLTNNKKLMELDWKNDILIKWNNFMLSLIKQCKMEAPIAGFKAEYCNPSQLLRRAVGLSCYIVPIMQWIIDLGINVSLNSFRIIQSELYFENGKDIMDRLICWSKQEINNDINNCDLSKLYQSGSIKIKKLQGTYKSKINDFDDDLINILHQTFEPCNYRLYELLQLYPQLALKEFIWDYWQFKPSQI